MVPGPLDLAVPYYAGTGLSIALAGLAALAAGKWAPLHSQLWLLAGVIVLSGLAVVAASLYHRWYRHMRRAGADGRAITPTFAPPLPERVWDGGVPDLHPLDRPRD